MKYILPYPRRCEHIIRYHIISHLTLTPTGATRRDVGANARRVKVVRKDIFVILWTLGLVFDTSSLCVCVKRDPNQITCRYVHTYITFVRKIYLDIEKGRSNINYQFQSLLLLIYQQARAAIHLMISNVCYIWSVSSDRIPEGQNDRNRKHKIN